MVNPLLVKLAVGAGKAAGAVAKAVAVEKVVEVGIPEVQKAFDRHHEHNKELIQVPQFIGTDLNEAKQALEKLGFAVVTTLAKPNKQWVTKRPNEVVNMDPKAGRLHPKTLINLYYVTAEIIDQSDGEVELPILHGMKIEEAVTLVEKKGFEAAKVLAKPKPEFAKEKPGLVIDSDPKPNLLNKVAKTGTTIRIIYLDETVIAESLELLNQQKAKQQAFQENIDKGIKDTQKALDDTVKNVQKGVDDTLKQAQQVADNLIGGLFQKKGK